MNQETKQRIYKLFLKHFGHGEVSLQELSDCLQNNRIDYKKLGYPDLPALLRDLPEFIEGRPTKPTETARFFRWNRHKSGPGSYWTQPTMDQAPSLAPSLIPDRLLPVTRLEEKTMAVLSDKVSKADAALPYLIEAAYQQAKATNRLDTKNNTLRFFMDSYNMLEPSLLLTFKRMDPDDNGHHLTFQYVDDSGLSFDLAGTNAAQNPAKALENFAFLVRWEDFLQELADLAIPEEWDFCESRNKNYYILKKYIQYTFYRLRLEEKVAISKDRQFAAFNTGLVTVHYDDIYACFEPNNAGSSPWLFKEFTTAGHRGLGKDLVHRFNPLPQPVTYFTRKEDLLFDLDKTLVIDFDHIILENLNRFDVQFLRNECGDNAQAAGLLKKIVRTSDYETRNECYKELRTVIESHTVLYNRLKNRLDDAVELAKRQVRWNFKTAVPSYYPSRNTMNLMLPLHLSQPTLVDNVLVVELTPSGNYQGQTILTLEQAYIDARLVTSPEANWLNTSSVMNCQLED
ncbi:DUF3825 domain-containing protein [Peptococcus simiae]|uniref:DUF3825 domain-containing protein n=1 Tax=Peptococcus simiae TaxID=1643805 RepID=A0ABW9GZS7_9FIRM